MTPKWGLCIVLRWLCGHYCTALCVPSAALSFEVTAILLFDPGNQITLDRGLQAPSKIPAALSFLEETSYVISINVLVRQVNQEGISFRAGEIDSTPVESPFLLVYTSKPSLPAVIEGAP